MFVSSYIYIYAIILCVKIVDYFVTIDGFHFSDLLQFLFYIFCLISILNRLLTVIDRTFK